MILKSTQSDQSVLMVEDDKRVALALKIRLKAQGFDIRIASTVTMALEMATTQPPDIALLDYNLPDGNGIELMQTLLQAEGTSAVRVIIMTASKRIGLKEEALESGAFDFFEKPFDSSRLVAALSSAGSTPAAKVACPS